MPIASKTIALGHRWERLLANVRTALLQSGFKRSCLSVSHSEWSLIATSLPPTSVLAWRYSHMMPIDPAFNLALIPLAMWLIVPALTLALVRFATEKTI